MVNVFKGLLRDARGGGTVMVRLQITQRGRHHLLTPVDAAQGRGAHVTFPFATFERGVLALLAEIDPGAILPPKAGDAAAAEVKALSDQRDAIDGRLALIQAEIEQGGDIPVLAGAAPTWTDQKREVEGKLKKARRKAASPASEAWGEVKTLLGALDAAPDPTEARVRLRGALARVVDSIWLLMTASGTRRYCAVQVNFTDSGAVRHYRICHRPPTGGAVGARPGLWWVSSWAGTAPAATDGRPSPADMAAWDREHAERIAGLLPDSIDEDVERSTRLSNEVEGEVPGMARARGLVSWFAWGQIQPHQPNGD